jgi:large subunit ribosomal protein L18
MATSAHHRLKRHRRVRAHVIGTAARPRLCVFRSLKHISGQIIDDESGRTLAMVNDQKLKGPKAERAKQVGEQLAAKAKTAKITTVVFDRGGYLYHGRVKALAEGARAGGLKF